MQSPNEAPTSVADPIAFPGLRTRACLAPLLADPSMSKQDQLAWSEAKLGELARVVHDIELSYREQRRQLKEQDWKNLQARYEMACVLHYMKDHGLIEMRGCRTVAGYLAARWHQDDQKISIKQLTKYLLLPLWIPEHVVLSLKAGVTLLHHVAQVGMPMCIELLCGHILDGTGSQDVHRGAAAAIAARKQGLSDAEAVRQAEAAVGGEQRREQVIARLQGKGMEIQKIVLQSLADGDLSQGDVAQALSWVLPLLGLDRRNLDRMEPVPQAARPEPARPAPSPPPADKPGADTREQDEGTKEATGSESGSGTDDTGDGGDTCGTSTEGGAAEDQSGEAGQDQKQNQEGIQAPAQAPAEHWLAPITRAIKSVTSAEEQAEIAGHLVLAMAGRPPARVTSLVRGLLPRLNGAPEEVRDGLDWWLKNASQQDADKRWSYLYDLFITAQLPAFLTHLHCLCLVDIPECHLGAVQAAWRRWQLGASPLEIPEGASPVLVKMLRTEHSLRLAQEIHAECVEQPREVHVEVVSWLWEKSKKLVEELRLLLADLQQPEAAASG